MVGMPRSIKDLTFKTRREGFLEDDDIELSSIEQLDPVDRQRLKAHVAKLAVEGFFEDAPDEQLDSLKTVLELGVFAASMRYHLARAYSEQSAVDTHARPAIERLAKVVDKISKETVHLKRSEPAEYRNLSDIHASFVADICGDTDAKFFRMKDDLSVIDLLQSATALQNTFQYWLKVHSARGEGAPAKFHDNGLIQDLARLYERMPGKTAGVSAEPGGSTAKGPFVRFLEGWLRVIDPERKKALPSKSFIQRALAAYRESEKEISDFNLGALKNLERE